MLKRIMDKIGLRTVVMAMVCVGLVAWVAFGAVGCAPESYADEADAMAAPLTETLTVVATPEPHGAILKNVASPLLAQQGVDLQVIIRETYDQANECVAEGDADVGYFETAATMEAYNRDHGTRLETAALIHYEPFALYSTRYAMLDQVPDGARVVIPSNEISLDRALRLLNAHGLITLSVADETLATLDDITANPHNFQLSLANADGVASLAGNADLVALNGNYAIEAGFSVKDDALAVEDPTGYVALDYANVLVVNEGLKDDERVQALTQALLSQEAKDYTATNYRGVVLLNPEASAAFQRMQAEG